MSQFPRNAITVLSVEDYEPDRYLVRRLLGKFSAAAFSVVQVGSLEAAQQRLSQGGIDVVLLDLGLPDSYGLGTLEKLLPLVRNLPVIVLTGYGDETRGKAAISLGARACISKNTVDSQALGYAILRELGRAANAETAV